MKTFSSAILAGALLHGATAAATPHYGDTATPIKHVIVVVGENVSFDTLYGAYVPRHGQSIFNLLSEHIINADGSPGRRFNSALQRQGANRHGNYTVNPIRLDPYPYLPQPLKTGIVDLSTASTAGGTPDTRFPTDLPSGPFQITTYAPYGTANSATGDPAHRFFQMWQQTGGDNQKHDMFLWVANTIGIGGDNTGAADAIPIPGHSRQGGELMGFFNMGEGDAPFFKQLADQYALSDNYHQSIMGGTGANFFALATGDVAVYNDNGELTAPPANQIENPDPLPGTDNFYQRDGYAGGSYVNCSDPMQPGVAAIIDALNKKRIRSNCEPGAYYLVNNYDTPYTADGAAKPLGADHFVYPPQSVPTIGEALSAAGVSWKWYTGGRDAADVLDDPLYPLVRAAIVAQYPTLPAATIDALTYSQTFSFTYNSIGDPLNASSAIVNGPLRANLKGLDTLYHDIDGSTLPAVSFVVPKNLDSGHPGYSAPARYELFLQALLQKVQANPALWADTAIIITTDEGGGYFDSGYIQNLDFFGDGPRIPLLVVSPFAKQGHVDHAYTDHASILKFIEANWHLRPLSHRSRDRLPNPVASPFNPYRPLNGPAIGNLMSLFDFDDHEHHHEHPRHHKHQDR